MKAAIGEVLSEAKNAAAAGKDIILIGYSRGALACLIVAQRLKALNINVHSLVLLDPVDRYLWSSPYKLIPRNVLASFRAYRKLSLNVVLKYEGTIPSFTPSPSSAVMEKLVAVGNMMAPSNPFRPSFSSTIQGIERGDGVNPNDHARYDYVGSHGAMGGVGYEWVTEDPGCEASLIRDLTQWLADRIDAKFVLVPNYDPDLTAAYIKVGSVRQALTAAASAAFDMRLMSVGRLDAFIYKLRELSGI